MLSTNDQGLITGGMVVALSTFLQSLAPSSAVGWIDDDEGTHQPIVRARLSSATYLVPVVHAEASEEMLAGLLAQVAEHAGNARLQKMLHLVAVGFTDGEIAKVLA